MNEVTRMFAYVLPISVRYIKSTTHIRQVKREK